ncbi:MAG: pyruvate:ferredoxin (flavodoxin) oxidoreductase [Trueperaceae bacterium]|nr:pyruvate:ferredoxin (flavodoxin) oxidoreductase [Trueperaceae bacterium]
MAGRRIVVDGNEAAARVAHQVNEVIAIYPITPASPMGEAADAWSAAGRRNLWGQVPEVVQLQSEAGAAGTVHGALQAGALTTTFTSSQGLLLMIPNLFKIAGELTPAVIHVAARSVATHALSIFGDHSDVMSVRTTGWAMLFADSVQQAHDLALIAQAASLRSRVPFLHVQDGFRTSHEVARIEELDVEDLRALMPDDLIAAHRARALDPDRPVLRGTAQNPDVFFQSREAANGFYDAVPGIVDEVFEAFAARTGRRYRAFEYRGAPDADRVLVAMGSGVVAAGEAVDAMVAAGEKVGLLTVRLYRPFDAAGFVAALPESTRSVVVLDRTKEPGGAGEPLYQDVLTAFAERIADGAQRPRVLGGRYGLGSKEFTPRMAKAALDALRDPEAPRSFTVGIVDDVTHLSLPVDEGFATERADVTRAVFFGLGSDGTVGATKNSVKIIGEHTDLDAQGYFVYDSKKSGAVTVSHLRFGPAPVASPYLIESAGFVGVHHFDMLFSRDVLGLAAPGATVLVNAPFAPEALWDELPVEVQRLARERDLKIWTIDGNQVAHDVGMGGRINTIMQTCFFALSGVLPKDQAVDAIKAAIDRTYGKRGGTVLARNHAAVDAALEHLHAVAVPAEGEGAKRRHAVVPEAAPDFVERVTARLMAGEGDLLPVSAFPVDGTYPTNTARFEKRSIALEVPIWDPEVCTQCNLCALACPHAAIRVNAVPTPLLDDAPEGFKFTAWKGKDEALAGHQFIVQLAPDDCTGCGVCVDVCPARDKKELKRKAINLEPKAPHLEQERAWWGFFEELPYPRPDFDALDPIKASQMREPLFEFSGACAGCGETPYLKVLSQLYGDHLIVANATGCSSIYGGNLPTTPWAQDDQGRGPAWSNSLFEDAAEFGFGMRLAVDARANQAADLLAKLRPHLGDALVTDLLAGAGARDEDAMAAQRARVEKLRDRLDAIEGDHAAAAPLRDDAARLRAVAETLVHRQVWVVGGDGWAYDIGFGGLDHVLASGRDVNVLVLDTEVYSNTGGQASKATPRAAVAKFAASGKAVGKKDLGQIAMAYGDVYVAQIAIGASPKQTVEVLRAAAAWPGPSLVIAYSPCIAHGIDMRTMMTHQRDAVSAGYLTLFHYDPQVALAEGGGEPLVLDSRPPRKSLAAWAAEEGRFAVLARSQPERAEGLLKLLEADKKAQRALYERLAETHREVPDKAAGDAARALATPAAGSGEEDA